MHVLVIVLLVTVIPLALYQMWLGWWESDCKHCGEQHKNCVCPPYSQYPNH